MNFVLFYHSLLSDWNHGNAHFLRGIAGELLGRGHSVIVYEDERAWSYENLLQEHGAEAIVQFHQAYPALQSRQYGAALDLEQALDGAEVVIVHEWNPPELVSRIGRHRAAHRSYRLFFHDTHHRAVTARHAMAAYDLSDYDGVLAYGDILRDLYLRENWTQHAWTWHEAADTRVFHPIESVPRTRDLIWIGNWGDDERSAELSEFLIQPARALGLDTKVFGVRYPENALHALAQAAIPYGGWLPNFRVPEVFAQFRVTVHIPRLPYLKQLPGIPTIRPFEALACGIPLVCAQLEDCGGLFTAGRDFLVAHDRQQMIKHLRSLLLDKAMARELAAQGLRTLLAGHTCAHRVDELLEIIGHFQQPPPATI